MRVIEDKKGIFVIVLRSKNPFTLYICIYRHGVYLKRDTVYKMTIYCLIRLFDQFDLGLKIEKTEINTLKHLII